ncbi:MAG TPA: competence protein CoiA family protein [Rhabdochlamydiaceae bacterium]|nr:competence protein CoiA family protein [Rhabdochlamydiaceae bacterium]
MQLYALDNEQFIFAQQAQRHKNYCCPECQGNVRVRGGPHRHIHFYHLAANSLCNQHKKTLPHLQTQLRLYRLLPGSLLEKPYKGIHRIADVSWEQQKIVFEIQCSSISLDEAKARCRDYEKLGLTVVWILHDNRFNKRRISHSEAFLRQNKCYYTNIDSKGQGIIYDQFDIAKNRIKYFWGIPLQVDLSLPFKNQNLQLKHPIPQALILRLSLNLYFKGDLIDRSLQYSSGTAFQSMLHLEKKWLQPLSLLSFFQSILKHIKDFYNSALRFALESLANPQK